MSLRAALGSSRSSRRCLRRDGGNVCMEGKKMQRVVERGVAVQETHGAAKQWCLLER